MPLFRFRFSGDGAGDVDDGTCEFPALEVAYLDAYRSMVEIGAGLLLDGKDPTSLAVEIFAEDGASLMVLTYDEVFHRNRAASHRPRDAAESSRRRLDPNRVLAADIQTAFKKAQVSIEAARATIAFARAVSQRVHRSS